MTPVEPPLICSGQDKGASPDGDRATQASPQAPTGLGHPVSVPSAWTPGPWEAFRRPRGIGITGDAEADFVIPASLDVEQRGCVADYAIARCLTSLDGYDPTAERQANARLIAAAPRLYSQLEFAVKLLSGFPALSGTAQVEAMRAALRVARGES